MAASAGLLLANFQRLQLRAWCSAALCAQRTYATALPDGGDQGEHHEQGEPIVLQSGTLLRISSQASPVEIRTRSGMIDHGFIHAARQATWKTSAHVGADDRPILEIKEHRHASDTGPSRLRLTVPEKWIGVDATTHGQHLAVSKVVEADLTAHTHGGDCTLGQIRVYTAVVDTVGPIRCGSLQAAELSGTEVSVTTGTAPVTLQRLVGQQVTVSTQGQPVTVKSLYGEHVSLSTGGGPVSVGTLDCSACAVVRTTGGAVKVDSLDGHADMSTDGADVDVHLHSKVGGVTIRSGGGRVHVAVSPHAAVAVVVLGPAQVVCDEPGLISHPGTGEREVHFQPQFTEETRYGKLSEGRVVVDSGGGDVHLQRVGWMQALQQRVLGGKHAADAMGVHHTATQQQ